MTARTGPARFPHSPSIRTFRTSVSAIAAVCTGSAIAILLVAGSAAAEDCVDYAGYLHVADIVEIPGDAQDLYRVGDIVYVAAGAAGLTICTVAGGATEVVTQLNTPGSSHAVDVAGAHAYIADGPGGLQIADVSDPDEPVLVGAISTPG